MVTSESTSESRNWTLGFLLLHQMKPHHCRKRSPVNKIEDTSAKPAAIQQTKPPEMSEAQEQNPSGWRQTPSKTLGADFNHEPARPSRGLSMATFASDDGQAQRTPARPGTWWASGTASLCKAGLLPNGLGEDLHEPGDFCLQGGWEYTEGESPNLPPEAHLRWLKPSLYLPSTLGQNKEP